MSRKNRLQDVTADLVFPPVQQGVETRFPVVASKTLSPKTGPGQMLAYRGQMQEVEGEISSLKAKLEQYADSMPTKRLDPNSIVPSRWANRHSSSFDTTSFMRLKDDIKIANGNVQAILVRPIVGKQDSYEIVFGHRRHKACLELGIPVLAIIFTEPLGDQELFTAMDRENRERDDLSVWEQGQMYKKALEEGMYSSARHLASSLGVSHTWVNKALAVAKIAKPIVDCFRSPLEIQHRHAVLLNEALLVDSRNILKRAEKIRDQKLVAGAVVLALLGTVKSNFADSKKTITADGKKIGTIEGNADGVVVNLKVADVGAEKLASLEDFIVKLFSI